MAQSSNPPKRQLSRHHSFSRRDKITSERLTVHRCKRGTGCQCIPIPFAKAIPKQWTGRSKETPRFKLVFTNCRQSREREEQSKCARCFHTLDALGLRTLDLDYRRSKRTDQYGNEYRYRAKVKDTHDEQLGRWAWDVFLISGGPN